MINVSIKSDKDNNINYIFVSGHSNYAASGSDIVCAAVSTAMYMSVRLVEKVCPKYTFLENEKAATMELKIIETNEMTNIVLNNLYETLASIAEEYKKYIKIKI
jgi:uncharacterized protein YsxB (DUF464 family)